MFAAVCALASTRICAAATAFASCAAVVAAVAAPVAAAVAACALLGRHYPAVAATGAVAGAVVAAHPLQLQLLCGLGQVRCDQPQQLAALLQTRVAAGHMSTCIALHAHHHHSHLGRMCVTARQHGHYGKTRCTCHMAWYDTLTYH